MHVDQQRQALRNTIRIKRLITLVMGIALIGMTIHVGSVRAGDLDDQQLARTPTGNEAKLADGFDLSFDARAVIDDTMGDKAPADTVGLDDRGTNDPRVELKGIHKLKISLYPDDLRPGPESGEDPFGDDVER